MTIDCAECIEAALRTLFSRHAFNKGQYYHSQGRVHGCNVSASPEGILLIQGQVQGSEAEPYDVDLQIPPPNSGESARVECTCPVSKNCKHAAAVLLAALNGVLGENALAGEDEDEDDELLEMEAEPEPEREAAVDPALQTWLRELDLAMKPATALPEDNTYPPGENTRLLYLLKPQNDRVDVELSLVQLAPRGGYHRPRKAYVHQIIAGHRQMMMGLRPIDLLLAKKIDLATLRRNCQEASLSGAAGADALTGMIATGRCHLRAYGKAHPALRLGEPRPANPEWQIGSRGWQSAGFTVTPPATVVLPLAPPWYIDEAAGTCGPLLIAWPDPVALAWLQAPPVRPAQAVAVSRQWTSRAGPIVFPAPQLLATEDLKNVSPVPCLRLFGVDARSYYTPYYSRWDQQNGQSRASLAELTFEYAGWGRLPPLNDDAPSVMEEFREGKLRRLHRSRPKEALAEEALDDYLFTRADVQFYGLPEHCGGALTLEDDDWLTFVQSCVPELRARGWKIDIEPTFAFRIAEPESWYADAGQIGGDSDWFGVELGVVLEGEKLNLLPILLDYFRAHPRQLSAEALAEMPDTGTFPVTLADGRMLGFPVKRVRDMLGVLLELLDADALTSRGRLKIRKLRAVELSGLAGNAEWRWLGHTELRALNDRLRNFNGIQPAALPPNLQACLRPYQQEGLNWLQFLREYELAGVLADDMGLGKTVQALAHLLIEKESGRADRPSLVIAPTSLMTNWRQETERFAPGLRVLVLHGLDRKQHFEKIQQYDLIITSYPLLPRDQDFLLQQKFHCVILDEAQYIKNPKTIYAQVACQLTARHRLCLTGTPMENHLGELWSLFNFLLPGFLGDETRFNGAFRRPIEKGQCDDRRKLLARRIAPFLLRRRKEQVVKELPPKTEIIQNVELGQAQRDLYESIRLSMHQRVKEEIDKKGINRAHIIILDALLKLRQVCCDPRLLSLPSARKVQESAKLELLMDLIPGMIEEGRRILLFSQFTSMLALIEAELRRHKIPYVLLTGDTRDRATPIARFQQGQVPLFLISLKAGGTGLNLTAADTVIHFDPWWNPAVENQATDRAHRIGQDKPVFVYKLMTVGTVEEKIGAMQARKRELVDGLLNEDRRDNLKLTTEDLDVLFAPLQ